MSNGIKKILLGTISVSHSLWIPYATASLISYVKKDPSITAKYFFYDPFYKSDSLKDKDFIEKLSSTDILGLTCYYWNVYKNDEISKKFKELNPNGLVLYGGPDIPKNIEEQLIIAKEKPWVDYFFVGPGEKTFYEFLKNGSKEKFINGEQIESQELPLPYLDGTLDKIMEEGNNLSAPLETNRGCPYGCSYCDWGGTTNSKIKKFNHDEIKKNINKIMSYDSIRRLEILDANFGIYADDVNTINYIIEQKQKLKKDIQLTFAGFAKNGSKYIKEIMKLVYENFTDKYKQLKLSFQSLDTEVLSSIGRANIKTEKINSIVSQFTSKDKINVHAELILGLPGESKKSFTETLTTCIKEGFESARSYPLLVLPNTEMSSTFYKKINGIKTKTLYIPIDLIETYPDYNYQHIINMKKFKTNISKNSIDQHVKFDLIYECNSYSNQQLHEIYRIWFWFNTFYNSGVAKSYIKNSKLSLQEQITNFYENYHYFDLLKEIVTEFDNSFFSVYSPEPITYIDNLLDTFFIYKSNARCSELVKIYENKEKFELEFLHFYDDYKVSHFDDISKNKYPSLLSSIVNIDKFLL